MFYVEEIAMDPTVSFSRDTFAAERGMGSALKTTTMTILVKTENSSTKSVSQQSVIQCFPFVGHFEN